MTSTPTTHRRTLRAVVSAAVATTVLVVGTAVAGAHVTVDPSSAPKGSFSVLTFRVPNEKDTASTVAVTVQLPADHPIGFASVKPVPGWTAQVTKGKPSEPVEVEGIAVDEVVTQVTWTGGEVQPGQYQEFSISAGPLPTDADELVFTVDQQYSDGDTVSWDEPTPPSGEEPEHPAPTLRLTAAEGDGHGDAAADGPDGSADDGASAATVTAAAATADDVDAAETRGTIGLIAGVAGVVLGAAALVVAARRRPSA